MGTNPLRRALLALGFLLVMAGPVAYVVLASGARDWVSTTGAVESVVEHQRESDGLVETYYLADVRFQDGDLRSYVYHGMQMESPHVETVVIHYDPSDPAATATTDPRGDAAALAILFALGGGLCF